MSVVKLPLPSSGVVIDSAVLLSVHVTGEPDIALSSFYCYLLYFSMENEGIETNQVFTTALT